MKIMRKRTFSLILIFILLISCLGISPQIHAAPTPSSEVWAQLSSEPESLNSMAVTSTNAMNVLLHTSEGLTRLDANNKPIPGMAKSWSVSKDGLTWTFNLRDAKWSDGSAVTAQDFVYGVRTALNPSTDAPFYYLLFAIRNAEEYANGKVKMSEVGIIAKDAKTLEIHLENPVHYFLDLTTLPIFRPVKESFYKKLGTQYGTSAGTTLYNGPWKVSNWEHDQYMVLVKNNNYWNAKNIKLDTIYFCFVGYNLDAYTAFKTGELDITNLHVSLIQTANLDKVPVQKYSDAVIGYLEFNTNDSILKNAKIRKALTYALNRKAFIGAGPHQPALTFTPPVIKGFAKAFPDEVGTVLKDNNSTEAKQLLQEGMKELGLKSLPSFKFLADDSDAAQADAAACQAAWKKNLGITVSIEAPSFKKRIEKLAQKDFQICFGLWGPDFNDPLTYLDIFTTGNGNNHTGYSSLAFDANIFKASSEGDAKKRMELLVKAERTLLSDAPICPIYYRNRTYVMSPSLKGVIRNGFQDLSFYEAYWQK